MVTIRKKWLLFTLFCIPLHLKNICGHDAVRKHVKQIKHVATLSQLLNLEKQELEMLATFMGHAIHREYYIFGVGLQHGKSLDEIEVNLEGIIVFLIP